MLSLSIDLYVRSVALRALTNKFPVFMRENKKFSSFCRFVPSNTHKRNLLNGASLFSSIPTCKECSQVVIVAKTSVICILNNK
ncbi:hypothetical protein T01_8650 [Trichinella spiralis]|uniref:Uncharacterized protein n=1 Tax=Trichinella spiralis TaxID=6334 RepID=A0A0V1AUV1_TRISP|nr:hypothetical protein T01_8650 [Trichinella spiralis]